MSYRIVISGGVIVTETDQFRADIVIDDERIAAIVADSDGIDGDEHLDATDLLILPGVIDTRVSFREPDAQSTEGYASGGRAAAAGGTTTVIDLPQGTPTARAPQTLAAKQQRIRQSAITDVALWAGIAGDDPDRQGATDFTALADRGIAGFTSTMSNIDASLGAVSDAQLLGAMLAIAPLGIPYALHAENDSLLQASLAMMDATGRGDVAAFGESRPPLVEIAAVNHALLLAEHTGCWVHIDHVSTPESLRLINEARARGVHVTVSISAHLLTLTEHDLETLHGFGTSIPPLRSEEEVDALWAFVLDETIDVICSDHIPVPTDRKRAGAQDVFAAPPGLTGAQTLLPVIWDEAVVKRGVDPTQLVRMLSTNAAQMFGFFPRKGTIRIGGDADLVLFDPHAQWTIRNQDMHYRHAWTPFDGRTVTGVPLRTLRRGETIFDAEQHETPHPAAPGSGRFIPRNYATSNSR